MASTTLDVRATVAPARRPPAPVLAAAGIALLEAIAVVAVALTCLDGLFTAPDRPPGAVVALLLLALAAWAVSGAGGGLLLADGSGARLLTVVACGELVVLATGFVLGLTTSSLDGVASALPVPALALTAVAVPVGKLLLATAPSSAAWLDAGPRERAPHRALTRRERALRLPTLAVIGLALLSVTLLDPGADASGDPAPAATTGR